MRIARWTLAAVALLTAAVAWGCSGGAGGTGDHDSGSRLERRGEHDRDGGYEHGREGEESGTELARDETYDKVRGGARLILAYDAQTSSFVGTVENTTGATLKLVRVEVHLSNGEELGPTTPADLEPGEKRAVKLTASGTNFDRWSAHPEVGGGEHEGREGREGRGEHDRDGR